MRIGVPHIGLLLLLTLLPAACRDATDNTSPTPDHEGVLHNLTETSAEQLLGFKPVRPVRLPPDYAVHELWGQATLLGGTSPAGGPLWGAPYIAVYTVWPTRDTALPGGAVQLHQALVRPIPTGPGGMPPEQTVTIGAKQVEKALDPVGDSGVPNITYRWIGTTTNLHLLVITTTGGEFTEADVEAMIAALPD